MVSKSRLQTSSSKKMGPNPSADFLVLSVQKRPSHPPEDSCHSSIRVAQYVQGIFVTNKKNGDKFWLNVRRSGPKDLLRIKSGQTVTIEYEKDLTDDIAFGGTIDEKQIVITKTKRRKANVL